MEMEIKFKTEEKEIIFYKLRGKAFQKILDFAEEQIKEMRLKLNSFQISQL